MDKENLTSLGSLAAPSSPVQKAEALAAGAAGKDSVARQKAAQEFASLLFLEVLKAMRAASPQSGFSETDGLSRDVYTSMMDTEVARLMAKQDSSGLTKNIERAMDKLARQAAGQKLPAPTTPASFAINVHKSSAEIQTYVACGDISTGTSSSGGSSGKY